MPPIKYLFSIFLDEAHFSYRNSTCKFSTTDIKFHDYDGLKTNFSTYKKENPREKNALLHRTFSKNPLCFWRWASYFKDKRYELPYKQKC